MTSRIISFALAVALAAPLTALAQEGQGYERGQLLQVTTFSVDPADGPKFEAAVKQIAEAAGKANTPYRWAFLQDGSQYTFVYPVDSYGYFDDPAQFERSFAGSEGEAQMQEAMASFATMNFKVLAQEIVEEKAAWSYEVEGWDPTSMTAVHMDVMWLKPGAASEFDALNEEWSAFFGQIDYPYPYTGHEVHFGDTGRVVYVTFVDDLSTYYGANNLEKMIETKGMSASWQELTGRIDMTISRWEHNNAIYRPDMSYWPMEGATN
ncbi:MAG: hypothetical protein JSW46_05325 [Gemmatimonadota bacterium]|nr:MAG: hypothetical protein JSW46_05325 [Gemmatimonadota bacterium]